MASTIGSKVLTTALMYSVLLLPMQALAQTYGWEDFVSEYCPEEETDEDRLSYLEELKHIHENPFNINTATVDELSQLPFLDSRQIENIHAYIYLHGEMQTLGELRLVPLVDEKTIEWLRLFVRAEAITKRARNARQVFSHLRNDFSTRVDIPLYYRRGYMVKDGYAGDALYHRIRYGIGGRHFSAGLRMEKDAGERYYDSYGMFVELKDIGRIGQVVAGDYRIGFGEGLVAGSTVYQSKANPRMNVQHDLRPMKGMDETDFLRGAAALVDVGRGTTVCLFASSRKMDATLDDEGSVRTLVSGGYHRSRSEREKKGQVTQNVVGLNTMYKRNGFHAGLTSCIELFSRRLNPGTALYRTYYPKGTRFSSTGVCYGYAMRRFSVAGETALSTGRGGIATQNRMSWTLNGRYRLSAIQRYYSMGYYSFLAKAVSESGGVQNENALMLHLKASPVDRLTLTAYADFFYHAWPRYRLLHSSAGQDMMLEARYLVNNVHSVSGRYRLKRKESADGMETHGWAKVQWTATPGKRWKWQSTASLHTISGRIGWGIQQCATLTLPRPSFRIVLTGGYFDTYDYDSRIYFYQPSLYGSVSSGSHYGKGATMVLTARWTSPNGMWMAECKYGADKHFDRDTQGSGLQTIYSSWKNDISFQLRLKF